MDARRLRWAWALIPVFAVLFTLSAGRGWPIHLPGKLPTAPAASASFFVYAPAACRMNLEAGLLPQAPASAPSPEVRVVIKQGKAPASATVAKVRAAKGSTSLIASAPLELSPGINSVTLTLGPAGSVFALQTVTVTQRMFNAGNLLFCLSLTALAGASIVASRALGATGLHVYGGASLIGFLIVTTTATLLSWVHALTSGQWAATLVGVCLIVSWVCSRRRPQWLDRASSISLGAWEIAIVLALCGPMFIMQILSSVSAFDDLMYHGPRTAFWMENASALPFPSHNDRLSVFPFGGDLLFAFGTIISGSELPGKLMVFLAYPLSLFAMLATLKTVGVRSWTALGIVAAFATAPQVFVAAVGIKPDLWLVLLAVITLYWVIVAQRTGALLPCCLAAAAAAAALGVKWTAAPLVLLTPLLFLPRGAGSWKRRALALAATSVLALAFGGAGPVLVANLRASHHPFGPLAMRLVHQPEPGFHPMIVQLKRLLFILVDPPMMPVESVRAALQSWEISAAKEIGAMEPMREEIGRVWPGGFTPRVPDFDDRFALAWLFVFIGGAGGAVILTLRSAPPDVRFATVLLLGASAAFTFAVVTQTRWQATAGLPDRFLMPALAFGLLGAAWPIDCMMSRRVGPIVALGALLLVHALPFLILSRVPFVYGERVEWQTQTNFDTGSEFEAISHLLPPGRTILLVTGQGSRDYPLFRPREGFANHIVPWGKSPYNKAALDKALQCSNADTVILTSSTEMQMLWDPSFPAGPFLDDLATRPSFKRAPIAGDPIVFLRTP